MKSLKVFAVLALAILMVSCAPKLPQKDIDAANAAFTAAQSAKADVYAPDAFKAAQDAQTALQAELDAQNAKTSGKSYKAVPALAKALLEASKKAESDGQAGLEAAKAEVGTLLTDVQALITTVENELGVAAKAGKKAKVNVATLTASLDSAKAEYETAKTANDSGDFGAAKTTLSTLKDALVTSQTSLEAAGYTPL